MIVGAWIGGLCAARAVRLAGHRPLLIERNEQVAIGAALGLWPNAIRGLDRLGCADAVRGGAIASTRMLVRSADGRQLSTIDVKAIGRSAGAPTVLIDRPELHRLLAEGIDAPRIATVTGVDDGGVTLAGGEHVGAAATIGADGLRSMIRRYVAPESRVVDVGYTVVRGIGDHALADGLVCEAWGRDELIGAAALRDERTYWFYEAPPSASTATTRWRRSTATAGRRRGRRSSPRPTAPRSWSMRSAL